LDKFQDLPKEHFMVSLVGFVFKKSLNGKHVFYCLFFQNEQ
jgi:hypothetical protein